MARLRHCLIWIGVAVCVAACGKQTNPTPARQPLKPQAIAKPPATREQVHREPDWQSRIPQITALQLTQTLGQADDALARGQLERGNSPGPGALELYLAVLAVDAQNAAAQAGVQAALDALLERGRLAMRAGKLHDADRIEFIARSLLPEHPDLPAFQQLLADARAAGQWVAKANEAAAAGRLTAPPDRSALAYFSRAREVAGDFEPVTAGLIHWNHEILQRAWKQASAEDFVGAEALLRESARFLPHSSEARVLALRILEWRQARTDALLARGNAEVDRLRLDQAAAILVHAIRIAAQKPGVDALRRRIHLARHYGPFKPGQTFSERLAGRVLAPEMVVIPYGDFIMGSSDGEPEHQDNEAPAHRVEFKRGFAISRNEITVGDFKRFVDASRYRTWATRAGHSTVYDEKGAVFSEHEDVDWRRDHVGRIASAALPVVHIALEDALAYAHWLSVQTGQRYLLPTEAQFEYVLRAGGQDIFPWGKAAPNRVVGNLPGDGDLSRLGRRWGNPIPGYRDAFWGPSPVRNFPIEHFGTFDMIGNVSEWTLDCWHDSYQRAPIDGSAWVNPGCPQRVVRGASWGSSLDQARSASRLPMQAQTSTARLGFRVVREL